ncbi:MAG: multidrug effflux MFS transporter [Geminicoccaceae bacterium]
MPAVASWPLIVLLVALTALAPFAMQIFLPSLPVIQSHFDVSIGYAQLVFSLSGIAMAVGTLAYGPISDRFGRRRTILAGVGFYILGSAIASFAPTIEGVMVGRIVQAAGGVAGMVLARAIVRDLFDRERSAEMIAYLTVGMVFVPMLSPWIGAHLVGFAGWRSNFFVPGVIGIVALTIALRSLPETNKNPIEKLDFSSIGQAFSRLMKIPAFLAYTLQGAFSMAVFFSLLAGAPYIVQQVMGYPASVYGNWFILLAGGFMAGNFTAARISGKVGLDRMIVIGSVLTIIPLPVTIALLMAGHWEPWAIFIPGICVGFGQGLAMPNAQAGAVSVDPSIAGTASGLAGFMQMGLASLMAQFVGMIQDGTPYPTLVTMLVCAVLMLVTFVVPMRAAARPTALTG